MPVIIENTLFEGKKTRDALDVATRTIEELREDKKSPQRA